MDNRSTESKANKKNKRAIGGAYTLWALALLSSNKKEEGES